MFEIIGILAVIYLVIGVVVVIISLTVDKTGTFEAAKQDLKEGNWELPVALVMSIFAWPFVLWFDSYVHKD